MQKVQIRKKIKYFFFRSANLLELWLHLILWGELVMSLVMWWLCDEGFVMENKIGAEWYVLWSGRGGDNWWGVWRRWLLPQQVGGTTDIPRQAGKDVSHPSKCSHIYLAPGTFLAPEHFGFSPVFATYSSTCADGWPLQAYTSLRSFYPKLTTPDQETKPFLNKLFCGR